MRPQRLSYEQRVRRERLNGHYIPYDINDAMRELEDITSTTSQNAYAEREEDFVVHKLYFSFGRWLGLNWSLYEGSRMSAYFRDLGVDEAGRADRDADAACTIDTSMRRN